ncbi:unnamed protein product [Brachionus calyciflorus]|uniref:Uncharacterized protein n=1 Tax=Brachionus calyciflorus TaxID=104777 RepID=A0A814HPV2_9BILA|nr:unnamed protein product [Brachionus calyciflorus]
MTYYVILRRASWYGPPFDDDQFVNETITNLLYKYPKQFDIGLIDIIQPPNTFYPNFTESIKPDHIFNDTVDRIRWRKKQNYDISYLMNYASNRGKYYLQLEDDILCQHNFISEILKHVNKMNLENDRWSMIEFSELGFIGKLFRTRDLPLFLNMFLIFSDFKPIDLIHNYVFDIMACDPSKSFKICRPNFDKVKVVIKPALFQHVGLKSSLKGKIQKLKDKKFVEKIPVIKHLNPPATIRTSFKFYRGHSFEKLYIGNDYSWAFESSGNNHHITINFDSKFILKSYIIKSGSSLHADDIIPVNTTLEIKPSENLPNNLSPDITVTKDNYLVVDRLNDNSGNLIGNIDKSLWLSIDSLRLNVSSYSGDKWILIYEFGLF